jgi:hypothetical protein
MERWRDREMKRSAARPAGTVESERGPSGAPQAVHLDIRG